MNTLNALLAKQPCSPDFDSFVDELDAAGYVIVPKHPTYEMVMEGLTPAIPGSVSEIYKEMIKARPEVVK
jgi:hypothetical protein